MKNRLEIKDDQILRVEGSCGSDLASSDNAELMRKYTGEPRRFRILTKVWPGEESLCQYYRYIFCYYNRMWWWLY